jgi:hypothetical protein
MHDKPLARRSALIARSMGHILGHIDLIPGLKCDVMLKFVAVIDCAFTFQKISNRAAFKKNFSAEFPYGDGYPPSAQ